MGMTRKRRIEAVDKPVVRSWSFVHGSAGTDSEGKVAEMNSEEIHRLLLEAKEATDVRDGLLHSYEDLRDLLRTLVEATDVLLTENHRLELRLRRAPRPASDPRDTRGAVRRNV
jgi:hypothetical protein